MTTPWWPSNEASRALRPATSRPDAVRLRNVLGRTQLTQPAWARPRDATIEQVADALLADIEFQELRLTNWLGTPDGQLIEAVVLSMLPAWQRAEAEILIEAVALAARKRQQGQLGAAAVLTGAVAVVVGLLAVGLFRNR